MDTLGEHVIRIFLEMIIHQIFNDQCLDGTGTGDAFVEVAGNGGVELTDLPVASQQMFLKPGNGNHGSRHHQEYQKCQLCLNFKHDHKDEDQIAAIPCQIHHPPGNHLTDLPSITHDTGMQVADIVLVEK